MNFSKQQIIISFVSGLKRKSGQKDEFCLIYTKYCFYENTS
jgi:hypothetical protein